MPIEVTSTCGARQVQPRISEGFHVPQPPPCAVSGGHAMSKNIANNRK